MSPTDDQLHELVRRFATLDMAEWDDATFDRAREHLGWQAARYSAEEERRRSRFPTLFTSEEYDTGLGTERGRFARHGVDDVRSQISVVAGKGDALFLAARSALEEVLGPPSIMRGPGPLLRWRGPVRLLELERVRGSVYLSVVPAVAVEKDEYRTARWAEAEDGLGQLGYWQAIGRGPEQTDLFIPGGYHADGWAEFEERLAMTLSSVVADFALLDPSSHFTVVVRAPGERTFVQWTTDPEWGLQIEAAIPAAPHPTWQVDMAELGWLPPDSPDTEGRLIRRFPTLGAQEATTAARLLTGALRAYGPDFSDLWHQVISPRVQLLGIGLPAGA